MICTLEWSLKGLFLLTPNSWGGFHLGQHPVPSSFCWAVSSSVFITEQRPELWPQLSGRHCATVAARGWMGSSSRSRIAFAPFYTHESANSTCCPAAHQGICGLTQRPHQHPWWCMHRLYPTSKIHNPLLGLCKYQVKDKDGYSSPVLTSSSPLIKFSGRTHALTPGFFVLRCWRHSRNSV